MAPAPRDEIGTLLQTEIFGRFVLLEQLDASGGAETCRAVDLERELQPLVTVRRLPKWGAFGRQERDAFLAAGRLRRKASATLLAPFVDDGELGGVPYWATEYIPGVSVDRLIERAIDRGGLSLHITFTIAYCVSAVALDLQSDGVARQAGLPVAPLIHPRRVVVAWSGRPFFLGTSYEQTSPDDEEKRFKIAGGRVSAHADGYSLAGLVYELCTGLSFNSKSSLEDKFLEAKGPLGTVPAEARQLLLSAIAGQEETPRRMLHKFEELMKASGGGLFNDVAREIGTLFPDEQTAELAQIERDNALARRFRRRLKVKLPSEMATTKLRIRPASQEGLAIGDPLEKKKPPQDNMVLVKGGRFLFGTPDELPAYVDVAPFLVDRHPITCSNWLAFVEATGARMPADWRDEFPMERAKCPVVGVSPEEAEAYARWANKRLPSEVEWELMARGFDGRLWPWGDTFQPKYLPPTWNEPWISRVTTAIGAYSPVGDSPFGAADIGQAWEWTSTPHPDGGRVVRGGPWRNRREPPMVTNRSREDAGAQDVGFRCVKFVADLDD